MSLAFPGSACGSSKVCGWRGVCSAVLALLESLFAPSSCEAATWGLLFRTGQGGLELLFQWLQILTCVMFVYLKSAI